MAAEGHHPAIGILRVVKDVLHVGGGEVEVFHAPAGGLEPVALRRLGLLLQGGQRHGGHQSPLPVEDSQGHQVVPVLLIEQAQVPGEVPLGQVGVFDDPVINRVRNAHHPPQVAVQVQVGLGQHPLAVLRHQLLAGGGEAPQQADAHQQHGRRRHGGEGQGEHHLDAHLAVALHPLGSEAAEDSHGRSPFLSRFLLFQGKAMPGHGPA